MLAAQVLQCLSVGLMCWKSFANTLYVSAIFPSEMLDAQVLVCLSVGLKCRIFCWESCANTLYVSTIFPSENLAAQVLGVRIDWFEVLEVLEGECCLDNWVGLGTIIHPEMLASLCAVFPSDELAAQVLLVCLPIGWVEVLEVLRMLDAQVLVYLLIGLKCWKFRACWPHRYLCACLSVGLKIWKLCGCWMHRNLCAYRLG